MADVKLHSASFSQLDAATLYALLRLRVDVFVVEQRCPYPELDGRDLEPATEHLWLASPGEPPLAYLRVLHDSDGARIGRVVTSARSRGAGLAGRLVDAALTLVGPARAVRLHSQITATGLYLRRGFTTEGSPFLEDGIPHIAMVRPAVLAP
ncbi:GNAT family N-acetyltransferase [Actinomadura roseirufa]|uniref:GNAT family N-acetyltransferase n=1 Tax=Actinomadura roseirufa TaxID=2094049 RepID=UPI0010414DB7|nr:GNAT family N-acetyltransferase [Actinomadura roseirufa]